MFIVVFSNAFNLSSVYEGFCHFNIVPSYSVHYNYLFLGKSIFKCQEEVRQYQEVSHTNATNSTLLFELSIVRNIQKYDFTSRVKISKFYTFNNETNFFKFNSKAILLLSWPFHYEMILLTIRVLKRLYVITFSFYNT